MCDRTPPVFDAARRCGRISPCHLQTLRSAPDELKPSATLGLSEKYLKVFDEKRVAGIHLHAHSLSSLKILHGWILTPPSEGRRMQGLPVHMLTDAVWDTGSMPVALDYCRRFPVLTCISPVPVLTYTFTTDTS
jgi:hypothetical protein